LLTYYLLISDIYWKRLCFTTYLLWSGQVIYHSGRRIALLAEVCILPTALYRKWLNCKKKKWGTRFSLPCPFLSFPFLPFHLLPSPSLPQSGPLKTLWGLESAESSPSEVWCEAPAANARILVYFALENRT